MPGPAPKVEEILTSARALFSRHGLRKVRVEEVCADAHVSKRTFYKYFRNKDDLAIRVLGERFEESRQRVEAVLSCDCPIEEKVRQIIAVKSRLAAETSEAFYRETLDGSTPVGRFAIEAHRLWDERVRRFYADAQARGQIRADLDIDVLMALLVHTRALMSQPELLRLVPDFPSLVETIMKVFFYGMLPRPEPTGGTPARKRRSRR